MWNRIDSQPDAEQYESSADPDRATKTQTEVADDEERGNSGDLVRRRNPGRLAAGERKSSLDRRKVDAEQPVDGRRLEERRGARDGEKPARAGKELETAGSPTQTAEPGLERAAGVVRVDVL